MLSEEFTELKLQFDSLASAIAEMDSPSDLGSVQDALLGISDCPVIPEEIVDPLHMIGDLLENIQKGKGDFNDLYQKLSTLVESIQSLIESAGASGEYDADQDIDGDISAITSDSIDVAEQPDTDIEHDASPVDDPDFDEDFADIDPEFIEHSLSADSPTAAATNIQAPQAQTVPEPPPPSLPEEPAQSAEPDIMDEPLESATTLSDEDRVEFETQYEVLESLIEDITIENDHVLNVVEDMLYKIENIETLSAAAKKTAKHAFEITTAIKTGERDFEDGKKELASAIANLATVIDGNEISSPPSTAPITVQASSTQDMSLPLDSRSDIVNTFLQQQVSLLEDFESNILDIEKGKQEALADIKRYIHNLKGETGVLGFISVQQFLHELESTFVNLDCLKQKEQISSLLETKDILSDYFTAVMSSTGAEPDTLRFKKVLEVMKKCAPGTGAPTCAKKKPRKKREAPKVVIDRENPELVDFITETNEYLDSAEVALIELEKDPQSSEHLNEIFRVFHNVKGISGFLNLKDTQELAHNAESLLDEAREGRMSFSGNCAIAAFESLDMLREMVDGVELALSGEEYCTPEGYADLVDRLRNLVEGIDIDEAPASIPVASFPETAEEAQDDSDQPADEEDENAIEEAAREAIKEAERKADAQAAGITTKKTIVDGMVKISTSRLDSLVDAVGELVIANAMVTQEPEIQQSTNPRLTRNISLLGKITRELQELAMSMRMVSLSSTFHKMARVARDLSVKSGVPVDFSFSGEDTELDRTVVEEIGSPLVHMVRNAVDHGIETPEERRKAGKSGKGSVHLSAFHEGGNVVIKIADDGKGLDRDAIIQKALKQGLIKDASDMSDKEIFNLIFNAGFSTAKKVTDVSGRGVGMDVVSKCIENLRGRIETESVAGQGTTFTIRLPLTLAIIDGMLVRVGNEKYIIPTITINESMRPSKEQVKTVVGRGEMLSLRGQLLPLFRLYKLFKHNGAIQTPDEALLVIISGNGDSCALMVDELIGQQQVVIKALGKTFDGIDGISGGAIMGDGRVAVILDSAGIVRLAHNN